MQTKHARRGAQQTLVKSNVFRIARGEAPSSNPGTAACLGLEPAPTSHCFHQPSLRWQGGKPYRRRRLNQTMVVMRERETERSIRGFLKQTDPNIAAGAHLHEPLLDRGEHVFCSANTACSRHCPSRKESTATAFKLFSAHVKGRPLRTKLDGPEGGGS
jgi:hypothetical protein